MFDVVEGREVKRYTGQTQSGHMIRSCMGGAANGFVISGSEGEYSAITLYYHPKANSRTVYQDANIYVWHKSNDRPLEVLTGHGRGCVNDVSWNPASTAMFASAGGEPKPAY
jgi:WD40 repeat protein